MDVVIREKEPNLEIVYLYRLIQGYSTESYGLHCAKLAGIPEEIISRAYEIAQAKKECKSIRALDFTKETESQYSTIIQLFKDWIVKRQTYSALSINSHK